MIILGLFESAYGLPISVY